MFKRVQRKYHMLRITTVISPVHTITLRLEGQIVSRWVGELKKSCEELRANGDGLVLDLIDASFIDTDGLALLSHLSHRKAVLWFHGISKSRTINEHTGFEPLQVHHSGLPLR